MERISSPEQLNDYIRVSNPGIWILLTAVIVLLAGVCVWGVFGHLDTTLDTVAIAEGGELKVYIKEADIESIKAGQRLTVGGREYEVADISASPVAVDTDAFTDYAMHVGSLKAGEWVYAVTLFSDLPDGVYKASVVIDSVSPMSFVFN